MTSTSFNIGLASEKNSSRVLKPPGGGHSDIFGLRDGHNEVITPSKRRYQPTSTIGSCFNMAEETNKNESPPKDKEVTTNGDKDYNGKENSEVDNGIDENKAPSEPKEEVDNKKEQTPSTYHHGRVPPGGFSSGFW